MMGSGKSNVGKRLAKKLGWAFVDSDAEIVARAGKTIPEIFATDGEEGFRAIEADVLEELLEHHRPAVIATGGGVVLREDNRRRLQDPATTVVWLDASPAFLSSRVQTKAHRPLLHGPETPRQVLERLHAERAPLYAEVADIVVDVEPFQAPSGPSQGLAERIADLVIARQAAAPGVGTS
jgi:shikimate kinase